MVAGIVCEYNPFHKGHLYQIKKTKQAGADAVVCVMSGNFVQRGECAFLDKWKRARTAVRNGADVVIDLPVPWAVSSGESFARGSIFLLHQFGAELVSFGSESDSKEKLLTASLVTKNQDALVLLKKYMSEGNSYPLSLYKSAFEIYGKEIADIISSPNSTLAVEYIRQIEKYPDMDFLPIKRKGAAHDSAESTDGLCSASKIRELLSGGEDAAEFLPDCSAKAVADELKNGLAPCLMKNNERAVLSHLRSLNKNDYERYVSDSAGLASRIFDSVKISSTLNALYDNAKSKNYTHSRIRREVLNLYLGIERTVSEGTPPYMRILAVNEKGLNLLSQAKKSSAIPIVTKHFDMQSLSSEAKAVYDIQCSSTDKFALFSPVTRPCGLEQKNSMLIIK